MLKSFDIPFKSQVLGLYNGTFEKDLAPLAPARQVPILKTPEGHIVFDTLVIAETLVEAHPSAAPWPKNPAQRGAARSLVAQIQRLFRPAHPLPDEPAKRFARIRSSGRSARRSRLFRNPMAPCFQHVRRSGLALWRLFTCRCVFRPGCSANCMLQTARLAARAKLCGQTFSTSRFPAMACYGTYQTLRSIPHDMACAPAPWPGPRAIQASIAPWGPSENATCPYSGDPVTDF